MESSSLSFFGPAFLVCVGYLDPGKWATILEGGSRFGLELLWVLIVSSAFAALFYSLSSRLGLATGRNLAQICHDEYPRNLSVLLWIQCEVSVVILDLTVVLGIAIGLNALLGLSLATSVVLIAADIVVFLIALPHLGMRKAEHFTASIMGFVLFCFVVEALHSNATTSAVFHGMLPRLKGEAVYIAAGILGANITPFNFYLHSAVFQGGKRTEDQLSMNFLPYRILNIATVCSMALLTNIAVLTSAAGAFHNSGHVVITFQDAQALMEQMLSSSVAPAAFLFSLLCAGQLSTLTGSVAGQIALEGLVGANVSLSFHRIVIRVAAIIPLVYLVWGSGSEGTYQILIFSQVILALQLPYAIVPLVKVTSSQSVMGRHKNSLIVEVMAWVCVALIFFMNIWVVFDMFFGDSDEYVGSGSWHLIRDLLNPAGKWVETIHILSHVALVGVTTLSTFFLMWMISAPLKSDSVKLCRPASPVACRSENLDGALDENSRARGDSKLTSPADDLYSDLIYSEAHLGNDAANQLTTPGYECISKVDLMDVDIAKRDSLETGSGKMLGLMDLQHQISHKDSDTEEKAEPVTVLSHSENETENEPSLMNHLGEDSEQNQSQATVSIDDFSIVDSVSSMHSSSIEGSLSVAVSQPGSMKGNDNALVREDHVGKEDEALKERDEEVDIELLDKDDYDIDSWENLDQDDAIQGSFSSVGGSISSLSFEEAESGKSFSARSDTSEVSCGGSGSGSLSRLSGLGRAARRQFAALLDEFWSEMYDLHGQPISQTHKRWQGGVNTAKVAQTEKVNFRGSAVKETFDRDSSWISPQLVQRSCQKHVKNDQQAYVHPSYHSSALASSYFGDSHLQEMPKYSSFSHSFDERRYSSLRYPQYRNDFDNQPATIHGYKPATFGGRSGNSASGFEARTQSFHRQQGLLNFSSDVEPGRSFAVRSSKPVSAMSSCNFNLDNTSICSSAQCTEASLAEGLGTCFLTSSVASPTERKFQRERTHWDLFDGGENAVWDPLIYRVTGELDVARMNSRPWEREGSSGSFPLGKQPIGRGAYSTGAYSRSKNNTVKHQTERAPLSFDEISPSQSHKDGFSIQASSQPGNHSLWSTQPFEQLFGMSSTPAGAHKASSHGGSHFQSSKALRTVSMGTDFEIVVLNCLRSYVRKLLRLDGSSWLFRFDSGSDEDLIGIVAARERVLMEADTRELHKLYGNSEQVWNSSSQRSFGTLEKGPNELVSSTMGTSGVPHCGEGCVWSMDLVVSFGVWCIHRILELSLMESRPELWGKYTYVLNRLQGVLEPAFSKPRSVATSCICVISETSDMQGRCISRQGSADLSCGSISNGFSGNSYIGYPQSWPWGRNTSTCKGKGASASIFLEIIKEVETAIGARKGRTGTAAGDVAFPKGKENLASVLKRYKRRLGNRTGGAAAGATSNSGNRRSQALIPTLS